MEIVSNNVPRQVFYGYELTDKERIEFDYLEEDELRERAFFKYKGETYDMGEFMRVTDVMALHNDQLKDWHGYMADSYFSGILVRYTDNDDEIVVGQFFS